MAIYTGQTSDTIINGCLVTIRSAEYGKDARSAMANSVQRCYELAKLRAGSVSVPQSSITEHTLRIRNAVFGEEVRDALKTGLELCYEACGINVSSAESTYFNNLINAQTGEDLKNEILRCIVKCCQDIKE